MLLHGIMIINTEPVSAQKLSSSYLKSHCICVAWPDASSKSMHVGLGIFKPHPHLHVYTCIYIKIVTMYTMHPRNACMRSLKALEND